MDDYYVYVYIDPRNFEEFYYGEGQDSRKDDNHSGSKMSDRVAEIKKAGLDPIVRVIARGLSQNEAFLVEATLLWKLGKWAENAAQGHFADKFRPRNTLHRELPGFDFRNGFYYYNVGQDKHRNWDDYRKFRFISAGQGRHWRDAMFGFNEGDLIAAYLKGRGFVGIGKILTRARMIRDVNLDGTPLLMLPLTAPKMSDHSEDKERSEYVCLVKWLASLPGEQAKWQSGLYTGRLVRASLDAQPDTVAFLEREFGVCIRTELSDRRYLPDSGPQAKLTPVTGRDH